MNVRCALGKHEVVQRGIRNGKYEFGRCSRCAVDMMRQGGPWRRVPKGFRIVWRPKAADTPGAPAAGEAAFAQEVDLRGVTVLGERSYGGQRFALVVLNQKDPRSYRALSDEVGTHGLVARQVEARCTSAAGAMRRLHSEPEKPPSLQLSDLLLSPKTSPQK